MAVRTLTERAYADNLYYREYAGLSTDTKPTAELVTGSKFTEANTGDVYLFAEGDTPSWTKVAAGYVDPNP